MSENLGKLKRMLPHGAKTELARRLKCDKSKISNAFSGLVKDKDFMARLQACATEILREVQTAEL